VPAAGVSTCEVFDGIDLAADVFSFQFRLHVVVVDESILISMRIIERIEAKILGG